MSQISSLARKMFGTANDRRLRAIGGLVEQVGGFESALQALDDDALRARTAEFRERLARGADLEDLLAEAFAVVREASSRALSMRHFDVQLIGGWILHQGSIAEMKTGEGKTLVATLPVYLNALAGKGVHVVTVNDYLARRDAEWMGGVYSFLGLTSGCVVPGLADTERREAYAADVTYATNNELGFDYLRDNMKQSLGSMVQRDHAYAIVDEVDSILIDEARTPLIISGPTEDRTDLYLGIDGLIPQLVPEHYEIDEKVRTATLTEEGNEYVEAVLLEKGLLQEGTLYDAENAALVHHVSQALRAHKLFERDRDYILRNRQVVIVDEFTGRMMEGRRYGEGLHQAIEAKEGAEIQPENVTLASITFQNYFRLYGKLAGMTGTAMTEAEEFQEIYGLESIDIPTHRPMIREDDDDQVFRTLKEKNTAIIESIRDAQTRGQPVLVGTTSIEKSEALAAELKRIQVPHNVLNARYHEQEASIIADAGEPGAITIATNMAGRGTDIQLGGNLERRLVLETGEAADEDAAARIRARIESEVEAGRQKVIEAGGLWIVGTERHESRRVDNQLRGRAGRQGDPGRSTFFLSLEDDLMRIFGSERMDGMLRKLGLEEGEAIVHSWVNKAIEKAQSKVEVRNFDIRKNLLKYDDVMNDQRKIIFEQRREVMDAESISDLIADMRAAVIDGLVDAHFPQGPYREKWDVPGITERLSATFGHAFPVAEWVEEEGLDDEGIRERLHTEGDRLAAEKAEDFGPDLAREIEKSLVLRAIDMVWRDHIGILDHLRSVVGLRGFAQRNPLNEYKAEAFTLFEGALQRLRVQVTTDWAHLQLMRKPEPGAEEAASPPPPPPMIADRARLPAFGGGMEGSAATALATRPAAKDDRRRVGRNEPCPCGSGKKFKRCCGR